MAEEPPNPEELSERVRLLANQQANAPASPAGQARAQSAQRTHFLSGAGLGSVAQDQLAQEIAQQLGPFPASPFLQGGWKGRAATEAQQRWEAHYDREGTSPIWRIDTVVARAAQLAGSQASWAVQEQERQAVAAEEQARAQAELAARNQALEDLWTAAAFDLGLGSAAQARVCYGTLQAAQQAGVARRTAAQVELEARSASTGRKVAAVVAGLTGAAFAGSRAPRKVEVERHESIVRKGRVLRVPVIKTEERFNWGLALPVGAGLAVLGWFLAPLFLEHNKAIQTGVRLGNGFGRFMP